MKLLDVPASKFIGSCYGFPIRQMCSLFSIIVTPEKGKDPLSNRVQNRQWNASQCKPIDCQSSKDRSDKYHSAPQRKESVGPVFYLAFKHRNESSPVICAVPQRLETIAQVLKTLSDRVHSLWQKSSNVSSSLLINVIV